MNFKLPLFASSLLIAALGCALFSAPLHAQEFSSLEERMSAAEFRAAGLDKLTPEELAKLNEWLRGKQSLAPAGSAYTPAQPVEDRRGFYPDAVADEDSPIYSSIDGTFTGWSKRGDKFKLANGQIWEAIDSTTRLKVKLENPSVTLTPGMINGWFLQVEGYNTKVRVKRVR